MTEARKYTIVFFKICAAISAFFFLLKVIFSNLGWIFVFAPFVVFLGCVVFFLFVYYLTATALTVLWLGFLKVLDWNVERWRRK